MLKTDSAGLRIHIGLDNDEIDRKINATVCNFYWFRIDNKHMTEPWLDQALMESAYKCYTKVNCALQPQKNI